MKKLMIVMLFASTLQANEYSFICNKKGDNHNINSYETVLKINTEAKHIKFNARFKTFTYQKLSMLDNRYVKSQREYVNGKCELTKKSFNYKYDE